MRREQLATHLLYSSTQPTLPHDDGGQFYHNALTSVTAWEHPHDVLAHEGI